MALALVKDSPETPDKETILTLLEAHIRQRPGLEPGNYFSGWNDTEGRSAYFSEARRIQQQRRDAFELMAVAAVECSAENLVDGFRAYSGRLSIIRHKGAWAIDYCTGQYWPTEYRAAACAVLASALWDALRDRYAAQARKGESAGAAIRRRFRERFGRGIASRWFR